MSDQTSPSFRWRQHYCLLVLACSCHLVFRTNRKLILSYNSPHILGCLLSLLLWDNLLNWLHAPGTKFNSTESCRRLDPKIPAVASHYHEMSVKHHIIFIYSGLAQSQRTWTVWIQTVTPCLRLSSNQCRLKAVMMPFCIHTAKTHSRLSSNDIQLLLDPSVRLRGLVFDIFHLFHGEIVFFFFTHYKQHLLFIAYYYFFLLILKKHFPPSAYNF